MLPVALLCFCFCAFYVLCLTATSVGESWFKIPQHTGITVFPWRYIIVRHFLIPNVSKSARTVPYRHTCTWSLFCVWSLCPRMLVLGHALHDQRGHRWLGTSANPGIELSGARTMDSWPSAIRFDHSLRRRSTDCRRYDSTTGIIFYKDLRGCSCGAYSDFVLRHRI